MVRGSNESSSVDVTSDDRIRGARGATCVLGEVLVSQYAIGRTRDEVSCMVSGSTSTDDEPRERDRLGTLRIGDPTVDGV